MGNTDGKYWEILGNTGKYWEILGNTGNHQIYIFITSKSKHLLISADHVVQGLIMTFY
jgi:hypothetical protein